MPPETSSAIQPLLIGDQWINSADNAIESINPATGQLNCRISTANAAQVDQAVAVASAAAAQPAWRDMLPHVRAQILGRISDGVRAHTDA